jgi:hypothetical protein
MSERIDPAVPVSSPIPDIIFKMKLEIFSCYREALGADNLAAAIAGKRPPNQSLHYELIAAQVNELMQAYCKQHGILEAIPALEDTVKLANDMRDLQTVIKTVGR